jgi:hypothetical protein
MSNPTPSELLALARECMPKPTDIYKDDDPPAISDIIFDGEWEIEGGRIIRVWYDLAAESQCDIFDPIANPAHAWAVETWLFKKRDYVHDIYKRIGVDGVPFYVIFWAVETGGVDDFPDNLSAALSVLRKRGGK